MAKILMYHGIDLIENQSFNNRFISQRNFEAHLLFYKENYEIITVQEAFQIEYINNDYSICLTFDDGYENNLNHAYPLLVKHKMPFAIYCTGIGNKTLPILWADLIDIATPLLPSRLHIFSKTFYKNDNGKFLELKKFMKDFPFAGTSKFRTLLAEILAQIPNFMNNSSYDDYWKLLNNQQIKYLSENDLVTIGSHAFWHNNLANIDIGLAQNEINDSLEYLENITHKKIETLAFPDGSYNRSIIEFCIQNDVNQLLGSHYLFCKDIPKTILQHRIGIYPSDNIESIKSKIEKDEPKSCN